MRVMRANGEVRPSPGPDIASGDHLGRSQSR